jgi:uncharacterized protein YfdQ (DUF2303 family)
VSDETQPLKAATAGDAQTVADLAAQALGVVQEVGERYVVVVPKGAKAEIVDLERYGLTPWRPSGDAQPKSLEAFIAYVQRHRTDLTTVWVEPLEGRLVAVLNDHGHGQDAQWGDLRATLVLPETPEWTHWMRRHRVYGSQREFAEHVQDGLAEIRQPDGATVLELVQDFQATVTAEFRTASRLDNGAIKAVWSEEISKETEIPAELTLALSPFYGEEPYEVLARIRYRVSGGEFAIGYELDRPERVIMDALARIRGTLVETFGDIVYTGTPAPSRARS